MRDSLSIELIKKLKKRNIRYYITIFIIKDPEQSENEDKVINKSDIIIIGAPHKKYKNLKFSKKNQLLIFGVLSRKNEKIKMYIYRWKRARLRLFKLFT